MIFFDFALAKLVFFFETRKNNFNYLCKKDKKWEYILLILAKVTKERQIVR